MKIVINNLQFPYDIGCRILKVKHKDCPFQELEDIWEDIIPLTFKDIAQLENLEQRRVAMLNYGLDKLVKEIKPELVDKKTLKKTTTWVSQDGQLVTKNFNDTYELYKVSGKYFSEGIKSNWNRTAEDCYYVKCKDTSTDREYFIWVDMRDVARTNGQGWNWDIKKVNAIQAIAWTIQTDIPEGCIEKIVRQGDCVLIKPIGNKVKSESIRHLTEREYKNLLVAES